MASVETKLSDFLAKVLITPTMRPGSSGVCDILHCHTVGQDHHPAWYDQFHAARLACSQTRSGTYPVEHPNLKPWRAFDVAYTNAAMWRGEYGRNRRKLLRDCIRWLRSQGL